MSTFRDIIVKTPPETKAIKTEWKLRGRVEMLLWRIAKFGLVMIACWTCNADEPRLVEKRRMSEKVTTLPQSEAHLTLFPCSRKPHNGVPSDSPPTKDEVMTAEIQLKKYLYKRLDQPLDDYYRQYSAIDVDSKRVLIIHAFQPPRPIEDTAPGWRSRYITVCDAGKASWGVEYYIGEKKFINFQISSEFPPRREEWIGP